LRLESILRNERRADQFAFLLALLVALVVVVVVWRVQKVVDGRPDPYHFSAMGQSLANGEGFAKYGEVLHRRGPLYPLVLGLIYKLFGVNVAIVQLVQSLCHAGTTMLASRLGRTLFNARTGLLAALFCAFNPSLLRYVPDFHLETLLIFLTTLTVWRSCLFYQDPCARNGAWFGACAALAALTKPTLLLYPVVFCSIWVLRGFATWSGNRVRHLMAAATIAGSMAAVILPWTVRNYFATGGHVVLITTGASDAVLRSYIFTKPEYITLSRPPYTDAENESNAMFQEICRRHGTVWSEQGLGDVALDKMLSEVAREKVLDDPLAFIRKSFIGLFTFWYEMTSLTTSLVAGLLAASAWALTSVGLSRCRREGRPIWILLAPAVYMNVLLALLLPLGRYSVPILPVLWVAAAFGADTILNKQRVGFLETEPAARQARG